MDREQLLHLFAALADEGVEYVLIGGLAVNLHGVVRATEDVDLFVSPDEANMVRLRSALTRLYDDPEIDSIAAEDLSGRYPVVRYVPPDAALTIDLVARLGDRFSIEDLEVEEREIDGIRVRLATPRTLYRMKRDTTRPVDGQDAERLRAAFDLSGDDP